MRSITRPRIVRERRALADVEPGFIHQRAGAQVVLGTVDPHFAPRHAAQLLVELREQHRGRHRLGGRGRRRVRWGLGKDRHVGIG
jgi:hypothetical protein